MEAATPYLENVEKEYHKLQQKYSSIIKENNIEYTLNCGINDESIYFELNDIKDDNSKYINIFSLDSLKYKNVWFNQFSSLDKAIKGIGKIIDKIKLKENQNEKETKSIFFSNPVDEDDIITLQLKRKIKDKIEIIEQLKERIKILEQKNSVLESKINKMEKKFKEGSLLFQQQLDTMKENINMLKNAKLLDSLIVTKTDDINLLKKWISPHKNVTFNLIYRATRDGDTVEDFHRMCDYQSPTIVLCKTPGEYIFGGYTTLNYNNQKNKIFKLLDEKAFVFSLN